MKQDDEVDERQDFNPIVRTYREAPDFNRAWLVTDRPLSGTQRVGFVALSGVVGISGAMFLNSGILVVRGDELISGIMISFAGLVMFCLGLMGLWRLLKDVFR